MSELTHYGVKGMRWGVRKERTKPSFNERRQVRKLKGAYKASVKGLQRRTRMADDDRTALALAEKNYEKYQQKSQGFTKRTREKRDIEVQNAEWEVNRKAKALKDAETKQVRSKMIMDDRTRELVDYVNSLNDKYGKENVKQLTMRKTSVKAGEQFVIQNVYKTGLRVQDLPFIGQKVVGKQLSEWEKEYRYNEMNKDEQEQLKKYRK